VVVAETLIHGVTSLRIPEQLWVQALDGGSARSVTGPAITQSSTGEGALSDGSCGADGRCFKVVRVYGKSEVDPKLFPR